MKSEISSSNIDTMNEFEDIKHYIENDSDDVHIPQDKFLTRLITKVSIEIS